MRHLPTLGLLFLAATLQWEGAATAQVFANELRGMQDNAGFSRTMGNIGDIDGDGVDDLIVGTTDFTSATNVYTGRISLYSGANFAWIRDHDGTQDYEHFGAGVNHAAVGDVDGDGVTDYVIGAPQFSHNSVVQSGMAVLYSGATGSVVWTSFGQFTGDYMGAAVAGIGDVDGDGRADVAVNCGPDNVNMIDAYGFVITQLYGPFQSGFGASIAACGDVDGDGVRDFMVGASIEDASVGGVILPKAGAVHVFSGATHTELYTFHGATAGDYLGLAVAELGDVDGDQVPDLIASGYATATGYNGVVYVISGKTGTTIRTLYGANANEEFGMSLTGAGDMNHDGVDDYVIGDPFGGTGNGRAVAISGADGTQLYEWLGDVAKAINFALGWSVASGDFNRDGIADVVLGDPSYSVLIRSRYNTLGGVFQYFGCPAWWENYGAGWPGNNGIPGLIALNDPEPGAAFTMQLDNSLGATTLGVLFIGFSQTSIPTGKDGTFLVNPAVSISLSIPGTGLQLAGSLPNDPTLYFFDIYLQAIEADPFASKGLSFTPGLWLHCGYDLP